MADLKLYTREGGGPHRIAVLYNGKAYLHPIIGVSWPKDFDSCPECGGTAFRLIEDANIHRVINVTPNTGPETTMVEVEIGENCSPHLICLGCGCDRYVWDMEWKR